MHEHNELTIEQIKIWLVRNPNAPSEARLDMIGRLREKEEKVNQLNNNKNECND